MSKVNQEVKNIIEAALLVSGESLTVDKMLKLFPKDGKPTRDEIKNILVELASDYKNRGIELKQIDRSYRVQSKEKYSDWLGRLKEEKAPRYTRATLETLAIIAYRQPVTRGDIEDVRGVSVSTDIIRNLQEREWIKEVGHRDVPGKPALLGTTRAFLEYFNLKSLDELPSLAELRDLSEIGKDLNFPLDWGEPKKQEQQMEDATEDEEDTANSASDDLDDDSEDDNIAHMNPVETEAALSAAPPSKPWDKP